MCKDTAYIANLVCGRTAAPCTFECRLGLCRERGNVSRCETGCSLAITRDLHDARNGTVVPEHEHAVVRYLDGVISECNVESVEVLVVYQHGLTVAEIQSGTADISRELGCDSVLAAILQVVLVRYDLCPLLTVRIGLAVHIVIVGTADSHSRICRGVTPDKVILSIGHLAGLNLGNGFVRRDRTVSGITRVIASNRDIVFFLHFFLHIRPERLVDCGIHCDVESEINSLARCIVDDLVPTIEVHQFGTRLVVIVIIYHYTGGRGNNHHGHSDY